ncbi:superinfection immunity protein [Acidobacteria bacterium AB60]|nr:superinfection immunity protein [Acidobacteria bacterium AB60]
MTDGEAALIFVLAFIIGLCLYFLPAIIAKGRGHHNTLGIFVLNWLLGWSFLGWVAALVWACTDPRRDSSEVNILIQSGQHGDSSAPASLPAIRSYAEGSPLAHERQQRGSWMPLVLALAAISAILFGVVIYHAVIPKKGSATQVASAPAPTVSPVRSVSVPAAETTPEPGMGQGEAEADDSDAIAEPGPDPVWIDATAHRGQFVTDGALVCPDRESLTRMENEIEGATNGGSVNMDLKYGCDVIPAGTKIRASATVDGWRVEGSNGNSQVRGFTLKDMVQTN